MKNVSIIVIIFLALCCDHCEKSKDPAVEPVDPQPKKVREFLNSEDFCRYQNLFNSYGTIGIGKVQYLNLEEDSSYQLVIPIKNNDSLTAYIQVVKMPESELPDSGVYFMNLLNLRGFDRYTKTGKIRMFGVNYNVGEVNYKAFEHSDLEVRNNVIVSYESFQLPAKFQVQTTEKGRISDFLACYRATREYMNTFNEFYFLCDVSGDACALTASAYCLLHRHFSE